MAKVLMVIAPERFRDEELFVTKEELEKAGHHTVIASSMKGGCPGSRGGSNIYFRNEEALRIAKEMHKKKAVVAAICLAPVILANAGILNGKKATVAGTEAKTIENAGAMYTGPGVMVDGNIVTGNAPKSSRLFGQNIATLLKEDKE